MRETKNDKLAKRLEGFMQGWISNPAAQREFVDLIDGTLHANQQDHADAPLQQWIDDTRAGLKYIGC